MDNSIAFISDKQDPKTMARNICSQCHRVLCSSGVRQPASPPATQIILSWSGQRNLYTFQECQQRATETCIHLGNCAGKDLQHTAGGAKEICIHFRSASRGPQGPVYISATVPAKTPAWELLPNPKPLKTLRTATNNGGCLNKSTHNSYLQSLSINQAQNIFYF